MTPGNDASREPTIFSATLTPYRSLGPTGFLILMGCLGGASFATGVVFILLGAWPVFGFLGLDVLLVYIAFRANYRAANAYEEVTVTASELTVRKVTPRGRLREQWTANPRWVRLQQDIHEEFGVERLFLISRGKRLAIAGFLGPEEKKSFARALSQALFEARRGKTQGAI
ncbi:MAG TPA: DUF2244 domain-containing protein [Xanthobacteraceae bacterium]|nr:DUF2244 domain-containing protein [Xanthobacteraceae bacterium]